MEKLLVFRLENANGNWVPSEIEGLAEGVFPSDETGVNRLWGCMNYDVLIHTIPNDKLQTLIDAGYSLHFLEVLQKDILYDGYWVTFPKDAVLSNNQLHESYLYGVKQVIVVRTDLMKGKKAVKKGKMLAQAAHASINSMLNFFSRTRNEEVNTGEITYSLENRESPTSPFLLWLNGMATKIVVGVENEEKLLELQKKIEEGENPLPTSLVTDAGLTEFNGPTVTCLGIGPWLSTEIDKITKNLPLI